MSLTLITTPNENAHDEHAADTMVLRKREPSRSGSQRQTEDEWGGTTPAAREWYQRLATNPLVQSIRLTQNGRSSTVSVTWKVEFGGDNPEPQDEGIEDDAGDDWNCEPIIIPTALAAHPYFQVAYVAGGEIIEEEIARADAALQRGREYVASGPYKEWVKRYYGLRMAGVEEWPQLGVEIRRNFETTDENVVAAIMPTVGQVVPVANIGMPAGMAAIIAQIRKIRDYGAGGAGSSDPGAYNLEANTFEWLHRPLSFGVRQLGGDPPVDRYTATDTYWGIWKWSAVIYPEGSWDPMGEVEE